MKIGIDVSQIIYETGVSVYTRGLVKHLLEVDQVNKYVLFGGSFRRFAELRSRVEKLGAGFEKKIWPIPPLGADILFNILRFPRMETFVGKVDIFHSSDWTQPPTLARKVTTVHDLAPIRYPRETHPRIVAVHRRRLALVEREVDRIIVPSVATKDDLVAYGVGEERIRVIPEAPTIVTRQAAPEEIDVVKRKYKITGEYLLTIGVGKRKNTQRLIAAFEKVRAGKNLKLVLVGERRGNIGEERGLRFTGHVSDSELRALICGARVLVYPSLYEGFGLPVLEGFAAQIPVVTSNISSLPQVAGEGAVLVDPYEIDAIAEGIERALKETKLIVQKGSKRLKDFSWEKTARQTLAVYNELC